MTKYLIDYVSQAGSVIGTRKHLYIRQKFSTNAKPIVIEADTREAARAKFAESFEMNRFQGEDDVFGKYWLPEPKNEFYEFHSIHRKMPGGADRDYEYSPFRTNGSKDAFMEELAVLDLETIN